MNDLVFIGLAFLVVGLGAFAFGFAVGGLVGYEKGLNSE